MLFLYKTIFHLLQDWIVEKLKSQVPALRLLLYSLPLVELQLFDWEPEKQIAWETDWSWNSSRESTNGFPWCFGARWFGFLGSPKMKGIGILRGIPPKPPGPKAPRKTIGWSREHWKKPTELNLFDLVTPSVFGCEGAFALGTRFPVFAASSFSNAVGDSLEFTRTHSPHVSGAMFVFVFCQIQTFALDLPPSQDSSHHHNHYIFRSSLVGNPRIPKKDLDVTRWGVDPTFSRHFSLTSNLAQLAVTLRFLRPCKQLCHLGEDWPWPFSKTTHWWLTYWCLKQRMGGGFSYITGVWQSVS